MPEICEESQSWITEELRKPADTWLAQTEMQCTSWPWPFNWLCTAVTALIRVVTWIVEIVMRLVAVIVCIVAVVLDVVGWIYNLILSIPIIGRLIKLILNVVFEIVWRITGGLDALLTLAGAQIPKKMRIKVIIPKDSRGVPIATEADVLPQVRLAQAVYLRECNIDLVYQGTCVPEVKPDPNALVIDGDVGSIIWEDLWTRGSYYEAAASLCAYQGGFFRVIGLGGTILVFIVSDVLPFHRGISPGLFYDYLMLALPALPDLRTASLAHEIGHACGLDHVDDPTNLMRQGSLGTSLYPWQRAGVRNSRHCVFV